MITGCWIDRWKGEGVSHLHACKCVCTADWFFALKKREKSEWKREEDLDAFPPASSSSSSITMVGLGGGWRRGRAGVWVLLCGSDSDELSRRLSRNGGKRPPLLSAACWAERFHTDSVRGLVCSSDSTSNGTLIVCRSGGSLFQTQGPSSSAVCTLTSGLLSPGGVDDLEGTAWLINDAPKRQC